MELRPCIDIHNGKVKQIVGSTLSDETGAKENFVSPRGAAFFSSFYRKEKLKGGHIINLNKKGTAEYELSDKEARMALSDYPGGMMIGGGITDENIKSFIEAGASHGVVSSFAFSGGDIKYDNLKKLKEAVGREHVCLDLSVKRQGGDYYIVTDRWQKFTNRTLTSEVLGDLEEYCDEYLIHATDVEGKADGIDEELMSILAEYDGRPVTYAGGVGSYDDIELINRLGKGRINFTIGTALDLFGGPLEYSRIKEIIDEIH
ncbi:MAG: phosphoribosylformimino-5-aminoimidazole carboxamide ribotide isomerase [Lachnospiraceae bacterium]|nr:phosphoribosylformimino-5-aminoimidazole carboxamide ribotide isomerase [Lachnospiraceae bacterium]